METPKIYFLLLVLSLSLVFFNSLMSKAIYDWVPSIKKQALLYALVWLIPIFGLFLANKFGNLGWFRTRKSTGGTSSIAGGFMQADSIFNPGAKHTIDMIEKQKAEIRHDYKLDDKTDENNKNM
ncbi:hypothetical protein NBRC116494_28890 [Aurantivibrio plasticivorans]